MQNFAPKIILAVIVLGFSVFAADKTRTYKGAWFEIRYPSNFSVTPSIKSESIEGKYESAFFTSPDKSVRFYIFSPQWAGENADVAPKAGETVATEKTEKDKDMSRRYFTITPKSGGMTRSYVENTNADATVRWVIGIEYASKEAYEKHKSAYLKFKKSLKQFAD